MRYSKVILGDCLTVLTDYHSNGSYERLRENVKLLDDPDYAVMIRTTNFEKDDFVEDVKYIDKHAYHFLAKSKIYPGDILMNKIASPGSVFRMPDLGRPVSLAMNLFLLRTDEARLDQTYAYYWLKANESYVKNFACGAATATITKKAVRELEISLPEVSTQRRVADILLAYEGLIENSQRRIRILEAMARAFYRKCFVCENLAPHKTSFSFHKRTFGSLCELVKDPFSEQLHQNRPLLDLSRMPQHALAPGNTGQVKELTTSRILFEPGDILFGAIRCYLHKVVAVHYPGVTNTSVLVLRPTKRCFRSLAALIASDIETIRWAETHSTGTKMPVISWSVFQTMPAPLPSMALAEHFESLAGPIMDQIGALATQIQNLRRTRDLLLPKLISGEVTV